ncbi:hypothetical protein BRC69_02320, partial [Halobacteriales archaeon QH_6_66_25]
GLWTFDSALPVDRRVTLGEGWTPLVDAPDWNAAFKLESLFPTGSFKDRGAAVMLSLADALGVDRVLEDSSGNAGAAVATYAARAGIDAEIYVPADVKAAKLRAIERAGADVVRVEGDRQAVTDACVDAVADGIQITAPARRGQILDAIEDSGGDAVAVDEAATERHLERLHRSGFYTEPTCAVAPAALETLREAGDIGQEENVVVPLTGSGLKT